MPLNLFSLFMTFLKAGGLTIGDGYATVTPLRQALVTQNHWMSEEAFEEQLSVVQAMPGFFAINLPVYMGHHLMGWRGTLGAAAGMLTPPLIIFIVLASCFNTLREQFMIDSFLRGARPAVVGLIVCACLKSWRRSGIVLSTVWIPVGAALTIGLLGVSPTLIVLGLTVAGLLYGILVLNDK